MKIVARPKMNRNEIAALQDLLEERAPRRVLEWGGGGSTLYWPARFPQIEWVTIEHDPEWYEGLRARIADSVTLLHLEPPDYHDITASAIGMFDLIIVDGHHRVQCLDHARDLLAPGGVVVLHDSSQRRWRPGWKFYSSERELAAPNRGKRGLILFEKPKPTKVFGVGLSKTGTVSLNAALGVLGYRSKHFAPAMRVIESAERYDALTDTSVIQQLDMLDRLYPGAKFVLTVRDEAAWLESCRRHWAGRKPRSPGWEWNRMAVYGIMTFDEQIFARVRREHTARVVGYFADRPGKLLVMDVCAGDGYAKLCPFLNAPTIDAAFPDQNKSRPAQAIAGGQDSG